MQWRAQVCLIVKHLASYPSPWEASVRQNGLKATEWTQSVAKHSKHKKVQEQSAQCILYFKSLFAKQWALVS